MDDVLSPFGYAAVGVAVAAVAASIVVFLLCIGWRKWGSEKIKRAKTWLAVAAIQNAVLWLVFCVLYIVMFLRLAESQLLVSALLVFVVAGQYISTLGVPFELCVIAAVILRRRMRAPASP